MEKCRMKSNTLPTHSTPPHGARNGSKRCRSTTSNQAMQPAAAPRTLKLSIPPTSHPAAMRALARRWLILFSLHLMRLVLLSWILFLGGCAAADQTTLREIEWRYVVRYYDRNHDGKVDFELHDIPGAAD